MWNQVEPFDNVWEIARFTQQGFPLRTTAVRLPSGELMIYSPSKHLGEEKVRWLESVGEPRYLIAPNHFHHLGHEQWRTYFPAAQSYAHPAALPRLNKSYPGLFESHENIDFDGWLIPEGTKNGELWIELQKDSSRLWITCDAFFTLSKLPAGLFGFLVKNIAGIQPGLSGSRFWRPLHLKSHRTYANWLNKTLDDRSPNLLLPCHGAPYGSSELGKRLKKIA